MPPLALCAALALLAAPLPVPTLRGHVNDLAQALPAAARAALEARLAAHEAQSGQQLVVLVVPQIGDEPIEEFTLRVAEAWHLGRKGRDDGLLMVVALAEHRVRIEVGYGLEGRVTDVLAHRIIVGVLRPAFRDGDYAGGIGRAMAALMQAAGGEAVTDVPAAAPPPAAGGLGGLALLFLLLLILLPALLLPRRRGWGGWGGGGFGGGGFGGFGGGGGYSGGGGGFGGGGASGDW